jgi:hypothetical protein
LRAQAAFVARFYELVQKAEFFRRVAQRLEKDCFPI